MRAKTIFSALVIAPVSILRSWEKEARRVIAHTCVPNLQIYVLTSQTQRKDRQRILRSALSREKQMQYLIITSYGLVSNDPLDFLCGNRGFDYVVLDEAHRIKNDSTQVTNGCRQICGRDNTHRLLLTGTPIQNNLKELWVLFDFATSGRLLGPYRR
jgi:DNA excision repair protein ERCC-6-like